MDHAGYFIVRRRRRRRRHGWNMHFHHHTKIKYALYRPREYLVQLQSFLPHTTTTIFLRRRWCLFLSHPCRQVRFRSHARFLGLSLLFRWIDLDDFGFFVVFLPPLCIPSSLIPRSSMNIKLLIDIVIMLVKSILEGYRTD